VADIHEGYQPPLGRVGRDSDGNIVKGTVLLQRGEQSLPALKGLNEKIAVLNDGLLPRGMRLDTIYDRTALIDITTRTVRHVVITGLVLVTVILLVFLGDVRLSLLTALTTTATTLVRCKKRSLPLSDLQLHDLVAVEGAYKRDGSTDATKITIHRKWWECKSAKTPKPAHCVC
jgi:cobalt-zinc-cadmium resistance protein CzcA